MVTLFYPIDGAVYHLHTAEQQAFFQDKHRLEEHEADPTPQPIELSCPNPVRFAWVAENPQILTIAGDRQFKNVVYEKQCDKSIELVYNLIPGRTYFWKVGDSGIRSFSTAEELPRWIRLPDVPNVRDIGGWKNTSGKKIKYNMIFRGAQLNSWKPFFDGLNDEGREIFLSELKIRTDMDIRSNKAKDVLASPQVRHCGVNLAAYAGPVKNVTAAIGVEDDGIFSPLCMSEIKRCFELFADENNYPFYVHCAGGGDRTGSIIFLLEVILGLDKETVLTEYELSNLSFSGERVRSSSVWKKFENKLATYAPIDNGYHDAVISFLHACKVTDGTIKKIQSILLE